MTTTTPRDLLPASPMLIADGILCKPHPMLTQSSRPLTAGTCVILYADGLVVLRIYELLCYLPFEVEHVWSQRDRPPPFVCPFPPPMNWDVSPPLPLSLHLTSQLSSSSKQR